MTLRTSLCPTPEMGSITGSSFAENLLVVLCCLRTGFQGWNSRKMFWAQKAKAAYVYTLQAGWSVRGADSPMEDLKVFIDVNVELGTNRELLLDNEICHAGPEPRLCNVLDHSSLRTCIREYNDRNMEWTAPIQTLWGLSVELTCDKKYDLTWQLFPDYKLPQPATSGVRDHIRDTRDGLRKSEFYSWRFRMDTKKDFLSFQ